VIRRGGGLGESGTQPTTSRFVSRTAGVSGKSELMWPSGPIPRRCTSKFGASWPSSALAASTAFVVQ